MHISIFCSADGNFDSTEYDEKRFDFEKAAENLLKEASESNPTVSTNRGVITGGGGKKVLSTVNKIYCMCRKYDVYNGIDTTDILDDDRDFKKYERGINGNKIVQCTEYHKELIIVLGRWDLSTVLTEYIAECTIYKKRQVHFLK